MCRRGTEGTEVELRSHPDWNPDYAPVHEDFVDRALAGAIAVLRGETVYPKLLNAE